MGLKIHITLNAPSEFERYNDDWIRMRLNELIGVEGIDIPHVDRPSEMLCCEVTSVTTTRTA